MAELEEIHELWSMKEVKILVGEYAGSLGRCHGPYCCYGYDIYVYDAGEMLQYQEGDFTFANEEDFRKYVKEKKSTAKDKDNTQDQNG